MRFGATAKSAFLVWVRRRVATMAVLVASMDSLLLSPLMGGAADRFRYAYNNVAAHSHHHVVTVSHLHSDRLYPLF